MTRLCVGIDIGGTNMKAGLLTDQGTILEQNMMALTEADKSEEGIVNATAKMLAELLNSSGFGRDSIVGAGIGIAGVIDAKNGIITKSPQFPQWKDFEFAGRLSRKAGVKVAMENDVNAIARGEQWVGAAKGVENFVCLAIGTGLGGAVCLNGEIWRGEDGMAGEIGHLCIDPDGIQCTCGSTGCLETIASAWGLIRKIKADDFKPVLEGIENDAGIPHHLALLAEGGNQEALQYWNEFGRAIGQALGGLLNLLNVRLVLIGGGLAKSFKLFFPAMETELQKRAFPAIWRHVQFRTSKLWEDAGIYGAAANLLLEIEKNDK